MPKTKVKNVANVTGRSLESTGGVEVNSTQLAQVKQLKRGPTKKSKSSNKEEASKSQSSCVSESEQSSAISMNDSPAKKRKKPGQKIAATKVSKKVNTPTKKVKETVRLYSRKKGSEQNSSVNTPVNAMQLEVKQTTIKRSVNRAKTTGPKLNNESKVQPKATDSDDACTSPASPDSPNKKKATTSKTKSRKKASQRSYARAKVSSGKSQVTLDESSDESDSAEGRASPRKKHGASASRRQPKTAQGNGDNSRNVSSSECNSDGSDNRRSKRRPHWLKDELGALLHACNEEKHIIRNKFRGGSGGRERKIKAWERVAAAVNVVSKYKRTVPECDKKIGYYLSNVKKKNGLLKRKYGRSGAGKIPKKLMLKPMELLVLDYAGEEPVLGIHGLAATPLARQPEATLAVPENRVSGVGWNPHRSQETVKSQVHSRRSKQLSPVDDSEESDNAMINMTSTGTDSDSASSALSEIERGRGSDEHGSCINVESSSVPSSPLTVNKSNLATIKTYSRDDASTAGAEANVDESEGLKMESIPCDDANANLADNEGKEQVLEEGRLNGGYSADTEDEYFHVPCDLQYDEESLSVSEVVDERPVPSSESLSVGPNVAELLSKHEDTFTRIELILNKMSQVHDNSLAMKMSLATAVISNASLSGSCVNVRTKDTSVQTDLTFQDLGDVIEVTSDSGRQIGRAILSAAFIPDDSKEDKVLVVPTNDGVVHVGDVTEADDTSLLFEPKDAQDAQTKEIVTSDFSCDNTEERHGVLPNVEMQVMSDVSVKSCVKSTEVVHKVNECTLISESTQRSVVNETLVNDFSVKQSLDPKVEKVMSDISKEGANLEPVLCLTEDKVTNNMAPKVKDSSQVTVSAELSAAKVKGKRVVTPKKSNAEKVKANTCIDTVKRSKSSGSTKAKKEVNVHKLRAKFKPPTRMSTRGKKD